ncbi:MAG: hypothetical protein R3F30_08035 [Planctomycetota bacterium]
MLRSLLRLALVSLILGPAAMAQTASWSYAGTSCRDLSGAPTWIYAQTYAGSLIIGWQGNAGSAQLLIVGTPLSGLPVTTGFLPGCILFVSPIALLPASQLPLLLPIYHTQLKQYGFSAQWLFVHTLAQPRGGITLQLSDRVDVRVSK